MQQVSYFRRFRELRLRVVVLAVALSASSAFAQRAGHWTGTNSFGFPMDFYVSTAGFITSYSTGLFQSTCPSGAQPFTSVSLPVAAIPILEGSFRNEFPIGDGGSSSFVWSGAFTSDTEANGNYHYLSARFRVQGKDVDTQICISDSTWTASWESAGAQETSTRLDENQRYMQVTSEWQPTTVP